MKRYTTMLLSLAAAFAFAFAAFGAKRTVRVGFFPCPGCHMTDDAGGRSGYGYDFYEKLAAHAGWSVEYVGYDRPWIDMLPMLERGEIDILGFAADLPERRQKFAYSKSPMAYFGTSLRTLPSRVGEFRLEDVESWRKCRVGVLEGGSVEESFSEYAAVHDLECEIVGFSNEASAIEAVKKGELDLVAVDGMVPFGGLESIGEIDMVRYHVITRVSDTGLKDEVDRAIRSISEEDPKWMTRLKSAHYPVTPVVAYIPETMDKAGAGYLKQASIRIAEINGWDIDFRKCRSDFSDADFSVPAIVCGVVASPEVAKRFDLPAFAVGRRRVDLMARSDDSRFTNGIGRTSSPYRVGVLELDRPARSRFEDFAEEMDFPYVEKPVSRPEELRFMLADGQLDMIVCPSDYVSGFRSVGSCGYVDFYVAAPKGRRLLVHSVSEALKFLRFNDPGFYPWLERCNFHTTEDERRHVVLGVHGERGLCERDHNGEYNGFIVDFVETVAKRTGWNLSIVMLTYADVQRALDAGCVDMVGALMRSPERGEMYDFSRFNIGSLKFALMKRPDGRMRENDPATWHQVVIGLVRGNLANRNLQRFLDERGVRWRPRYYNRISEAEAALRRGEIDAAYTLANGRNRDFTTLALLATPPCYFCSIKSKPWIKEEMDDAVDELLREDSQWINGLSDRYLESNCTVLELSVPEIEYVQSMKGREVTVSFDRVLPPLLTVDPSTKEVGGFYMRAFRRFSERTGLAVRLLPPGAKSDLMISFGEPETDGGATITDDDWFGSFACWVRRRGTVAGARGVVAVQAERRSEIEFVEHNGMTPLVVGSRRECYEAVESGRAESTIDNVAVARYMLDELREYPELVFQPIKESVYHRNVAFIASTGTDPRLRSIFSKFRNAVDPSEYDTMIFDSIYSIRPLSVRMATLLWSVSAILLLAFVVGFFLVRDMRIARAANKSKTMFLNSMSHDIRTPMNAITGFSAIARRYIDNSAKVGECLDKIDTAGGHLLQLINEVLDMSRVESGKVELHPEPTDIVKCMNAVNVLFGETCAKRRIRFRVETSEIRHRWAMVDPTRLDQVLLNVVGNAVKYTKEGSVSVTCVEAPCDDEGSVSYVVTVKDTGIGMSQDFLKHVYDPFSRESTVTISGVEGTGLGMSIVRRMVDLLGGRIAIESEVGKGTTVTLSFVFPASSAPVYVPDPASDRKTDRTDFRGCRVLLVEDNVLNLEIARFILESMGLVIDEAVNGQLAVDAVKASGEKLGKDYDFVLMDIQMPVMDGYEATRTIRAWEAERAKQGARRRAIPIIAMTANALAEDREKAFKAGMDEHIAKPVKADIVKSVLEKFL